MNIRIFFSSPGDVKMERETAKRIVDRLQSEIGGGAVIEPYFWEHEVMVATKDYQENIPHMDDFDIVVCILWSRLGTPLDPSRHPRPGGGGFASGTEYEFFTAMKAHEMKGTPDIFVFRNSTEPRRPSRPREAREAVDREIDRLDSFFDQYFQDNQFFTRAINIYSTLGEFEEKLTIALRSYIIGRIPNAPSKQAKKPKYDRQPYLGLSAFNYEDAPVFFGRTAQVGEIITAFQTQELDANASAETPPKHFVLILGSSGSGKSSLARAGVLPMLTNPGVIEGANAWRTAIFKPADAPGDPILALTESLTDERALPELFADGTTPREIADLIRSQPQGGGMLLRQALTQAGAQALTKQKHELGEKLALLVSENREEDAKALRERIDNLKPPSVRIALLADQLEELFTSDLSPETLANFIGILIALANSGRVFLLATLRSDFYPRCLEHPELIALMQGSGTYALPAPSAADIGQMIRQPAAIAGLTFEENASTGEQLDELLRDAALKDPAALPLLSYTLEQLYERREDDGTLTLKAYRDLGGLEGAIGSRAETVFTSLPSNAQAAFDGLCKQLVTLQEGGEPTRRRASYGTLTRTPEAKTLLDALINARLLSADQSPSGERVVSVAHEALLRHWPRLVAWVQENRLFLNTRTRVASRMADWMEKNKADDYLIPRGPNLSAAESILAGHLASLDPLEIEFIGKSAERVRREDQKKLRNARLITMGAIALCLIAVAGGLFAMAAKRQAQEERNAAIRQEKLAMEATEQAIAGEARTAYMLGINQLDGGRKREGMMSLGQTLTIDPNHRGALARLYSEHLYSLPKAIPVRSFTANAQPTTRQRISGAQQGPQQYMAFITDRKHPALLDLGTMQTIPGPWENEPDSMAPVISDNSHCLANIRMDRTTRIWNVASGKPSEVLTASENFSQLGFTQDGELFIDCDGTGGVSIIDASSGRKIHFWQQKQPCNWLAVSENRYIISISTEELVIYDRETGTHRNVDIPLDGRTLISCRAAREGTTALLHMRKASADGSAWEDSISFIDCAKAKVVEGSRTLVFNTMIWNFAANYNASAVAVALHEAPPEVRHITDASRDGTFDLGGTYATNIAVSPDERLLAATDPVGTVTIFSAYTRRPAFYPIRHPDRIEDLLISWDGRYLLTSTSKIATVWDLAVGPALALPMGFTQNAGNSLISGDRLRFHLGNSIDWLDLNTLETKIEIRFPHIDQSEIVSEDLTVSGTYMPDKGMEFHSITSEPPVKRTSWKSPGGSVNYWEISPDGSTFAGTDEKGVIHFADTATGSSISSVEIPGLRMGEMLFTPDGRRMVVASKLSEDANSASRIFLIDVKTGQIVPSRTQDIYTPILRVSNDSRYIALSGNPVSMAYSPQILVWDTADPGKPPFAISHPNAINDFRFSPDSSLVALAGADMVARVFETSTFRQVAEPITATFAAFSLLAFSDDSTMLATASAGKKTAEVCVWNWREAKQVSTYFGMPVLPSALHFTKDGRKLVAIRATSLEADSKGCTVHTMEIMPPDDIVDQILPLTEAITAYKIRRGELPTAIDPLQSWDVIRKDFPGSWFLSEPAKRAISPGFSVPSTKWMNNSNVGIETMLTAMPAVSIANASISHWEQVSVVNRRGALAKLEPGSAEHSELSAAIAFSEARIASLISFAERNARTDPAVCYHLAQQARQAGNTGRAIEYCQKAIALDAAHEDAMHLLAIIYQDQMKLRDSNLLFRKLKDLYPAKPVYRLRLGLNLHSLGEVKEALPLLESIVGNTELDADDRALSLVILGRADEALPLFKTMAEDQKRTNPESKYTLDSLVHLITAYHRTGNTAEAVSHYRMFIAAEPQAASRSAVDSLTINRTYIDSLLATLDATLEKHPELTPKDSE
jgi:WD40 repeat protein/tetratricopeptide (TPR) repeat protein